MQGLVIYGNYGITGAEGEEVRSVGPLSDAVCHEEITVEVPDNFEIGENYLGSTLITDKNTGKSYLLGYMLCNGQKSDKYIHLQYLDINEHWKIKERVEHGNLCAQALAKSYN